MMWLVRPPQCVERKSGKVNVVGVEEGLEGSQFRRPRKCVKSVATIDSDDDKPTEQCQPGSAKLYDIYNPPSDLEILPVDERCEHCAHRILPCAKRGDLACFQCNKTKHACNFSQKGAQSRARLCAPQKQATESEPPSTPPPHPIPTPVTLRRSTRKCKERSPPAPTASNAPPSTPAPCTPGPSRGRRESKSRLYLFPFY